MDLYLWENNVFGDEREKNAEICSAVMFSREESVP